MFTSKSFLSNLALLGLGIASLPAHTSAAYTLQDDYAPASFFSKFNFFTADDPTHGFVDYIGAGPAHGEGLVQTNSKSIYMGVDHNTTAAGRGRKSVRLTSNSKYNTGLFILDASHMPTGCGTWPAFWLVGPNWPAGGEIDVLEGVNVGSTNQETLHTSSGCSISGGAMTGAVAHKDCAVAGADNQGCGIKDANTASFGAGFNAARGGVYATEVTSKSISIWFFGRGKIPSDISSGTPNPGSWGTPTAVFNGCDVASHFHDLNIVFDTTFCGDWAGNTFSAAPECAAHGSCVNFVRDTPSAFGEAYWTVNSLKVYSGSGSAPPPGPPQQQQHQHDSEKKPSTPAPAPPNHDHAQPQPQPQAPPNNNNNNNNNNNQNKDQHKDQGKGAPHSPSSGPITPVVNPGSNSVVVSSGGSPPPEKETKPQPPPQQPQPPPPPPPQAPKKEGEGHGPMTPVVQPGSNGVVIEVHESQGQGQGQHQHQHGHGQGHGQGHKHHRRGMHLRLHRAHD